VAPDPHVTNDPDLAWALVAEQEAVRTGVLSAWQQPPIAPDGDTIPHGVPRAAPVRFSAWEDAALRDNGPLQDMTAEVDAYLLKCQPPLSPQL
jgi:hypothetical protein